MRFKKKEYKPLTSPSTVILIECPAFPSSLGVWLKKLCLNTFLTWKRHINDKLSKHKCDFFSFGGIELLPLRLIPLWGTVNHSTRSWRKWEKPLLIFKHSRKIRHQLALRSHLVPVLPKALYIIGFAPDSVSDLVTVCCCCCVASVVSDCVTP